jgi:hypothetical protein
MNNDLCSDSKPVGWGLDTSITSQEDNKYSSKNTIPNLRALLDNLKKYIKRNWSLQTRTSRSHLTSPTSATLPSSTVIFIFLCGLWYTTSALSSNTGKAILTQFRYPVTLTFIQFGFVAGYCLLLMSPIIRFSKLRMPTRAILRSTLPMGMFQVGGHMFSSIAISRIPVSTVHTIKVSSRQSSCFTCPLYRMQGIISPVYRCRICSSLRCQLFYQDLLVPASLDRWRYACMFIRHVCI